VRQLVETNRDDGVGDELRRGTFVRDVGSRQSVGGAEDKLVAEDVPLAVKDRLAPNQDGGKFCGVGVRT
jgi:hypothetical protein